MLRFTFALFDVSIIGVKHTIAAIDFLTLAAELLRLPLKIAAADGS